VVKNYKLGPGTLKLGPTASATDISCQIVSGGVNHEYEEAGETVTTLCGDTLGATATRADSLQFTTLADLSASGMYQYPLTNDLETVEFEFVPNTTAAAKWTGSVQCRLPDSVSADEFGANLGGDITLPGVGNFTFAPAAA
jgi:hypothetical protein